MSLIIGADIVPTDSNERLFVSGDKSLIGDELFRILGQVDYRIYNMEVPLSDTASPINKNGPNLIAKTNTINGYLMLGANLVTLSNNHIFDHGVSGLRSTIDVLDRNNIKHVGAGMDIFEASKAFFFSVGNKKFGIYACCEHEFSIASQESPGANPFDPFETFDQVSSLKRECDFVIVLYHGGKEHYRYPSPNLQKTCRKMIDKGADMVVCQHSHCVGCEEKYGKGTIVYGQGNFVFDMLNNEFWETGLLIRLDDDLHIDYIPIVKKDNCVRLADDETSRTILEGFHKRSEQIKEFGFLTRHYKEFALESVGAYLIALQGKRTFIGRALNKLTKGRYYKRKASKIYNVSKLLEIENYINCEAHRELLLEGIKACNEKR